VLADSLGADRATVRELRLGEDDDPEHPADIEAERSATRGPA
jgi:hypothetical protein